VILIDTAVWINHLQAADQRLVELMSRKQAATHPFVLGELAIGNIRRRDMVLAELHKLPTVRPATHDEVMHLIAHYRLFGTGIGYIDAHLLAAARAADDVALWSADRRLLAAAIRLGVAATVVH
jgi:predicted nucleic acid-binding protein